MKRDFRLLKQLGNEKGNLGKAWDKLAPTSSADSDSLVLPTVLLV